MLPDLPDEVLLLVLEFSDLRTLRAVCSSHRMNRDETFWYSLARRHGVHMQRTSRSLRSRANLRCTLFTNLATQAARRAVQADQIVWGLWMQLHKADAAAAIKRTFDRLPDLSVDHRLSFYHGSTLLHLAARRGRLRSIRLLLDSYHATLNVQDDGGFTPLCLAAWSGRASAVRELLRRGADVTVAGTPPQSSWCGGRTAMTADVWAERKGFDEIVQLVRARRDAV
jgi:ankyrin repeat protein